MQKSKASADAKVALPITPMLDMTFQLLFFFIINFHPADLEGQMDMALPAEEPGGRPRPVAKARPGEPEFAADLTVKVRTQRAENSPGGIVGIFVSSGGGKDVAVEGLDGLKRYLAEKRETAPGREAVQVVGDSKLRIKHLMRVMAVWRGGGSETDPVVPDAPP